MEIPVSFYVINRYGYFQQKDSLNSFVIWIYL